MEVIILARNEKETRKQLIDPKLKQAGWDILTVKNVIEKDKACIETPVKGMPITVSNSSGNGFVDYTLFGDDGKPLALIEAKKSVVNEEQGRVQACLYADCFEKQYGVRPVIYYTNGYSIRIIDGVYPSRIVFGFHKKDELEYLIQRRNKPIVDSEPNPDICNRYYQKDAIREVLKHLGNKHSRSLIVLATGTGKTRVSCAISDIFIRNNFAKRILFLADRKNLVTQAKEETFEKFLPKVPMATIVEGKVTGSKEARIIFSTYQSMLSMIKDTSTCPYGIGHFDLIIVDEAYSLVDGRRGLYGDEAINTLVQEMENNRENIIVILAGYPDKMQQFLDTNPGLTSRIAFHINFDDYTEEELYEILLSMASKSGVRLSDEVYEKVIEIFGHACKHKDFGNGRFVRNIYEQALMNQSLRIAKIAGQPSEKELRTLEAEDFNNLEVKETSEKEGRRIGF